jgi:opacity protein-like surface antigen
MLKKTLYHSFILHIFVVWSILYPGYSIAQSDTKKPKDGKFKAGKWGIEANYMTGQFLKHGVDRLPGQLSQGFELNYFKKTAGDKPWQKGMNFPEIGVCFTFYYFGDNRIFGDAIALMAYGKFYIVRSKVADFYARIGAGYGLLTRKYNATTNPGDELISSTINLSVQLKFGLEWKINKYVQLNTSINFNHFSNSGMKLPNYGLNIPSGSIGIKVFPQPRELSYNCERQKDFKKNEIMWKYSIGIQQLHSFSYNTTVPTKAYPVPGGMIAYARYINPGNKFYGGLSFEYFPAIRDYIIINDIHTRYGAAFEASIPSVIVGDEFILGRMSMFYSAGAYLWKSTATITPLYFKVGMNVYIFEIAKRKGTKFFLGNNVKAHTNVAQYNEFSIGGTF